MPNPILQAGDEVYGDIPTGEFRSTGLIGHATCVRRWDCGWNKMPDFELDGKKYGVGHVYAGGAKEDAQKIAAAMGLEFVTPVMLVTVPIASVTNLPPEGREKFKNPLYQAAARLVGLGKDYRNSKHGAGFNLVTFPSMVDAYAVSQKWYDKNLFDVDAIGNISSQANTAELLDALVAVRQAIWGKLGETKNYLVNNPGETSAEKLKQALTTLATRPWTSWARVHIARDPSPGAIYTKKDGTGGTERNRVPVVTEFFEDERAAVAAGMREIEQRESAGEGNAADVNGTWDKLSPDARTVYGDEATWKATFPSIVADANGGKPRPIVAKTYGLSLSDLNAVVPVQ